MNIILIKIGGSILDENYLIDELALDLKVLQDLGYKIVIVHGGSKVISEALKRYQIPSEFIDGLRVTSSQAMKVIEMALFGNLNSFITKKLNTFGRPAIGLSGTCQGLFFCEKYSDNHGF